MPVLVISLLSRLHDIHRLNTYSNLMKFESQSNISIETPDLDTTWPVSFLNNFINPGCLNEKKVRWVFR